MSTHESTCWTVIRAAAAGSPADRDEWARRYLGVVRAYLAARWRGSPLRQELGDAVQEVFVECFRQGGALEAAGAGRVLSFRAFLYGVVRNVARRFESRPVRAAAALPDVEARKADYNQDGVVYFHELDGYVTERVKELSKGQQHPVTARPTSIRSFPLSKP
jgi:DNA-directed RNA polymerase specialized sigma24 family protein